MSPWLLVVGATLAEVLGTLALRMAATGQRRWYAAVAVGYVVAFVLLTLALEAGLPLGVVYGVWAASGVALTAVASRLLFDEPLTRVMVGGIALIAAGVLLVELGAAHCPGRTAGGPGHRRGPGPRGWRWRRDLNPRLTCANKRFRGVLLRPLGHATAGKATGARRGR